VYAIGAAYAPVSRYAVSKATVYFSRYLSPLQRRVVAVPDAGSIVTIARLMFTSQVTASKADHPPDTKAFSRHRR
jgi:hypothetical protein